MLDTVFRMGGAVAFELPSRRFSIDALIERLQTTAETVASRIVAAEDDPKKREAARHLIGIERWGQARLSVGLGEPFVMDEYDDYRPPADLPWESMPEAFESTRVETVALAHALRDARFQGTVLHNQWGELSVRGWLLYLSRHAYLTSLLLR